MAPRPSDSGEAVLDGPRLGPFAVPEIAGFGAMYAHEGEAHVVMPVALPGAGKPAVHE